MKNVVLFATTLALLGGCKLSEQFQPVDQVERQDEQADLEALYAMMMAEQEQRASEQEIGDIGFVSYRHRKEIANYAEQIALELADSALDQNLRSVAVTSFVDFNRSLRGTNQLGNQLAETLMLKMQQLGFQALDFKSTGRIDVTERGDFLFSRDASRLLSKAKPSHVLSGTLIYRERGVEVNARMMEFATNLVIASSSVTIPYFILDDQATASR
ncbi:FlgO family outer membrane protein [Pseudoalteromonas sp. T1lg65]|uniref:FlgO family outer membrane protein n=1 Tax=Pseudoalteromonas sp. T1lg65 TaxID=2077101 RepID=UPI003F790D3C